MTDLRTPGQSSANRFSPRTVGPPVRPDDIGSLAVQPSFLPDAPVRIPASRYTSPDFAALEAERLWPKVWQVACTLDHVSQPGDAFDCRLGALSAVVVRDDDGGLRAFQNVCRHRGNTLCDGAQHGLSELRCPFHRWSWDLHGELREVPSRRGFGNLDTASLRLVPVAVDTWGPLVFVNFDADAEPLSQFLEGMPADAAWADLEEFRCVATTRTEVPCNWKVIADGFSETYHIQGIHQEMLGSIDDIHAPQRVFGRHSVSYQAYGVPSPRLGLEVSDDAVWSSFCDVMGNRMGLVQEPSTAPPLPEGSTMKDLIADRIRTHQAESGVDLDRFSTDGILDLSQYNFFPNATLLVWGDMLSLLVGRPGTTPDNAELSTYSFARAADPQSPRRLPVDLARSTEADWGTVLNADVRIITTMQRGLRQPGFTEMVLSAEECRIINFHRNLERQLGL